MEQLAAAAWEAEAGADAEAGKLRLTSTYHTALLLRVLRWFVHVLVLVLGYTKAHLVACTSGTPVWSAPVLVQTM
jgi:hypothetical protein